jgi:hypothetical protein
MDRVRPLHTGRNGHLSDRQRLHREGRLLMGRGRLNARRSFPSTRRGLRRLLARRTPDAIGLRSRVRRFSPPWSSARTRWSWRCLSWRWCRWAPRSAQPWPRRRHRSARGTRNGRRLRCRRFNRAARALVRLLGSSARRHTRRTHSARGALRGIHHRLQSNSGSRWRNVCCRLKRNWVAGPSTSLLSCLRDSP